MLCSALFRNDPDLVAVPARTTLIAEGQRLAAMYVLVHGQARMTLGGWEIERLKPGAVAGEDSLVCDEQQSVSVVTLEDCTFIRVDEARFNALVTETQGFALKLMRIMDRRRRTIERLQQGSWSARLGANWAEVVLPLIAGVVPASNEPHIVSNAVAAAHDACQSALVPAVNARDNSLVHQAAAPEPGRPVVHPHDRKGERAMAGVAPINWMAAVETDTSDLFGRFPHFRRVETLWGSPECRGYLTELLLDSRQGERSGFDKAASKTLFSLLREHDDRYPQYVTPQSYWPEWN